MLTGKPPAEGEDVGALLGAVRHGEFSLPRKLDPSIDKPLEAVCLKAMALAPEDRYATPRALADDVERWLADEPVAAYSEQGFERLGAGCAITAPGPSAPLPPWSVSPWPPPWPSSSSREAGGARKSPARRPRPTLSWLRRP